jgi:hypothetical protein
MRMLSVVAAAALALAIARDACAARGAAHMTDAQADAIMTSPLRHVRAVDAQMLNTIRDGLLRSATFAELVTALNRSDVIVYIESRRSLPATLAGRMLLAAGPRSQRYLRIQVNGQPRSNELIALVAHELRHALEVANSPDVRNEQTLIALYERIGHNGSRHHQYDTLAAQDTGRQVRMELAG